MTLTPQEWLEHYTKNPKDLAAFIVDVNEQSQELFRLEDATAEYHKLTENLKAENERLRGALRGLLDNPTDEQACCWVDEEYNETTPEKGYAFLTYRDIALRKAEKVLKEQK